MEKTQVFDVEVNPKFQENVDDLLMVNEDYYLPDEEIVEYYTASAFIWMHDSYAETIGLHIDEEETKDGIGETVCVFLNENPIGVIRKDQRDDLIRLIRKGKITKAEPQIGGGPYKQVKNGKVVSAEIRSFVKIKVFYDTRRTSSEDEKVFIYRTEMSGGLG